MFGSGNNKVQLRSRLKGLPRDTGWHLGLNQSFFSKARGARILVYHGICKDDHLRLNTLFIKLKTFEAQLRLYKRYFNLVSLDDIYQQNLSKERFNICLSFDDGFSNNHNYVLPLLEQYEVPAAFFITAIRNEGFDILWNDILSIACQYGPSKILFKQEEFIKGKDKRYVSSSSGKSLVNALRSSSFEERAELMGSLEPLKHKVAEDYWLQMTEEQIRSISKSKRTTIGSHSCYHNDLANVSGASLKDYMARSKQFLENLTGKEISALAFPYGSYTKEVVSEAKKAGYSQLLATEFLFPEDVKDASLKERLTINPFISNINQLHANVTGNYK